MRNIFLIILLTCLALHINVKQPFAGEWVHVKWVSDGDTVILSDDRRVRYIGLNAPEIDHDGRKAEPYGYEAKAFNKNLVLLKQVRLESGVEKYDSYGRLLAYVFLKDGTFVNGEIISAGYAYCLYKEPNIRYSKKFLAFQQDAMSGKKGIWHKWKDGEEIFLGNRRSKRFHMKTCRFGKKTNKANRILFKNKWIAFWNGYAPCRKCLK